MEVSNEHTERTLENCLIEEMNDKNKNVVNDILMERVNIEKKCRY